MSALRSDSPLKPPARPQASPEPPGRPPAFWPSSSSVHKPPGPQTRCHEPLGGPEEQQENPADYGVGEQPVMETFRLGSMFTF